MVDELMSAVVFDGPAPDTTRTRFARIDIPPAGPGELLIKWSAPASTSRM